MAPPMTKLLRVGLLLMSAMSISVVLLRISAGDSEISESTSARSAVVIEQREYRILAEILPHQRAGAIRTETPPTTPKTANPAADCPQSHDHREDCEVVHVALTSWGTNVTRDTALLIKSIFLHRRGPIHLHILADQIATVILTELLRSWRLFRVSYTFYDLDELKEGYALKGSSSPEKARLLVQLALPEILPIEVNRVIVLNSDRIVAVDVRELWSVFSRFKHNQSFGAVIWPQNKTVGVGLLLLHVSKLRVGRWPRKRQAIEESLSATTAERNGTIFEQAALNTLYGLFPDLMYSLPCQYNHPAAIAAYECPINVKQVKVLEFISDRVPARFWKAFLKVVRYDGSLLRRPIAYACGMTDDDDQEDDAFNAHQMKLVDTVGNSVCKDYVRELVDTFRTHLFYLGSSSHVEKYSDVTLVTQLNIGRINTLEKLCTQWRGPMSVAVYLSDSDTMHFVSYVQASKVFSSRKNIDFHLLYEDGSLYPTNHLRNTAVAQVKTSHVFVIDVDFMPSPSLYEDLLEATKLEKLKTGKMALLVPAFETDDYSIVFPDKKEKLVPMLDTGVVYPFRNKTFARGHFATNYTAWKAASEPYQIEWEEGFEPYFAMRTEELPKYRENFMGYGMNKIVHIMEVTAQGYSFLVMPNSYIIHLPHAETFERTRHSSSPDIKKCMKMLEEDVARELLRKHGNESLNGWNPDHTTTPAPRKPARKLAPTQLRLTTMSESSFHRKV